MSERTITRTRNALQREIALELDTRLQQALDVVAALRDELTARLSQADGFELARLQDLRQAIDAGVDRLHARLGEIVQDGQRDAVQAGAALVDGTLATAELSILVPDVTESLLLALQDTTLGLVMKLTESLRTDLVREVQLGVLGVKDPFTVIQEIDRLLGAEGATGYANRAEAITRTEIGRAQSQATQTRLEDAQRTLGDRVQKEWRHAGGGLQSRPDHVAAHGQRRLVREPFQVGGVALMYPRDPAAPARATVNCRCVAVPYIQPR